MNSVVFRSAKERCFRGAKADNAIIISWSILPDDSSIFLEVAIVGGFVRRIVSSEVAANRHRQEIPE